MTTVDLKVISENGDEVLFKIRDNTPLEKVLFSYCDRMGITTSGVLLKVNNTTLKTASTSKDYGFKNDQIINAIYTQPPQKQTYSNPMLNGPSGKPHPPRIDNVLNLRLLSENGNEVYFKVRDDTPLLKILTAFCDRQQIAINTVMLTVNNKRLNTALTSKDYGLIDNQVIHVARIKSQGQLIGSNLLQSIQNMRL